LSKRFHLQPLIPAFRISELIFKKRHTCRHFLLILFFWFIILTFLIIARKDTGCRPPVRDAITRPTNDQLQTTSRVGLDSAELVAGRADQWSGT
jgi:hypothetical protein